MSLLGDRIIAVHRGLAERDIAHAIGGAIALGYCTGDPRTTVDIDCNVFTAPADAEEVFAALPAGVTVRAVDRRAVARDGQVRLWWDTTPLDLFFANHPFHAEIATRLRHVPFEGVELPVLECTDLAVFKAFFNRTKDWADIEAMLDVGSVDVTELRRTLVGLLRDDDPRVGRLDTAVRRDPGPERFG